MKKLLFFFILMLLPMLARTQVTQKYFPEGTKWTEIRLDTLKYDSWYSKVGDEWVPNFETIEYYVQGEYVDKRMMDYNTFKKVYTNGPEWSDSLTLLIQEVGDWVTAGVIVNISGEEPFIWIGEAYQFDWSVGKGLYFRDISSANLTSTVQFFQYYGIINEIKEGYFGGIRPLKYVDLDGKAPDDKEWRRNFDTNGGRIIHGIGITEWNDDKCLFGPTIPYSEVQYDFDNDSHYRSMLVHFERNGEVLYDVWPKNEVTYHPLIEEDKVWTYHYQGFNGREFNVGRVIDGDTIIGGVTYKKIYDQVGGQYQYALREEGKKVYIVYSYNKTASLLYDFGKNAGDVIDELAYPLIVASVDTIDIDGVKFRRMRVQDANKPVEKWSNELINMYNFWIEGVGSESLLETSIREPGNAYNLLSCQINGRVYTQQELLGIVSNPTPQDDYRPFVKVGKKWDMIRSDFDGEYHHINYRLTNEKVEKAGKTYMKMYRREDYSTVADDERLLREENRKVYIFDPDLQKEFLLFDYSLKAGDTYETYSYDDQKMVSYKVLSVSNCTEGPESILYDYDEERDSMITQRRYLRKWTVCRTDDNSIQKTWIESVGSLEGPLANLYARPISFKDDLAYVEDNYYYYLPFSFHNEFSHVHGCNLPTGAEDYKEDDERHKLTYELEGNRLHVYGKAFTQCGPNNYAYFYEKKTDDPLVNKIQFVIQEAEPMADCMALHATNFYVPGFDPNMNYIVIDNQGEEHPVINKTPQMDYRPLVEEGKVWKVGISAGMSNNQVKIVKYYYFDGDTIIDGKTCKQMMCQKFVSPDYPDYALITQYPLLNTVGAWYEEDKKVYIYNSTSKQFKMMYDFSLDANDILHFLDKDGYPPLMIGPNQTGGLEGFKGVYRDIMMYVDERTIHSTFWLEGVGSIDGPTANTYYYEKGIHETFLMSCTIGDEIIYLNDEYEDGATPESMGARKNRFDFTHTIKTKPKARKRSEEEPLLYGEYNDLKLDINLNPLDDAYQVRITDDSGKVVYEKVINAGNIVGLNIDISAYAKGRYTVTVENSDESFTGEFYAQTTGIVEVINKTKEVRSNIYNLQGQRLSSLQKGLNIVNGQKIFVK